MRKKKIAAYLDTGSIRLFAQQIADTLGNVIAVAIHDTDGQLLWAGPQPNAEDCWPLKPFLRERLPGPGFCERLSNKNFVYVFYLGGDDAEDSMATLSVQIDPSNPTSYEFALREIKPILGCIERQLAINIELASVRRMTAEGSKGLQLLVNMDELDASKGQHDTLRSVLRLAAVHFQVEFVALVLPNLGIQETCPASLLEDKSTSKKIMSMLGALISFAKKQPRVLLSAANITTRAVAGLKGAHPKVLCSPIINSKDNVIGIFILMGPDKFSNGQVRLVRAICAKVLALTRTADQLSSEHFSRHGLLHYMENVLQRHPERPHALLYLDIDKLHVVNDAHGHMAGDQVIRTVSRIIDELANTDDAISHLSGDCFALFLRDCEERRATAKAELILDTMNRENIEYNKRPVALSASIGIAMMPDVVSNASAALNTAEIAARSAKGRGGNQLVVFRDLDASVAQRRNDLDQVNHLQYALIQNRFVLYAQPIQSIQSEESCSSYEILIRMVDEQDKLLLPAEFLSSAERYQMMSAIDRWVIKNTLDKLANADNTLQVSLSRFNINISAQSLADDDFLEYIETRIAETGVSPDSLCFEITETAIVRNLERAQRFIRRLRKLGCRLALDDFGTGYCSFAYLKDLPVQYIKIDGVFVRDMLENPISEAIVVSIANIAKVMHASTVAEHVENDLVMQRLRRHGIDYVQGFSIGKPMPLTEVLRDMGPPVMYENMEDPANNEVG